MATVILRLLGAAAGGLLLFLIATAPASRTANAAIINVPCDPNALTSAINTANSSGGPDVLELVGGCTYVLQAVYTATDSGIPGITSDITINGNGATIVRDGTAAPFRIFWVDAGGVLTLNSLSVVNGRAKNGVPMPPGTQGQNGGAVLVHGSLTVTNSILSGNAAGDGYSWVSPDPIFSGGSGGKGGAIYLASAGSSANIVNSTIGYNNRAGNGGNGQGTLSAGFGGRGGAIYVEKGTLTMVNSTVTGNSAGNGGTLPAPDPGGSTGGIYVDFPDASATITNTTIAGNTAGSPTPTGAGAGITAVFATVVKNSLIANNTPGNCGGVLTTPGSSNNIATDATCVYNAGSATQKTPTEVNLQTLADNGGPTPTMALLAPSAAIDAGTNAICAASPVSNLDQRGATRPYDGDGNGSLNCDLGAFEAYPLQGGPTFNVNTLGPGDDGACQTFPGACSLREAINAANADGVASTVALINGLIHPLTEVDNGANGLPLVSTPITINGNGATIQRSGANRFRIFSVIGGGSLTLNHLTITGGFPPNGTSGTGGGGIAVTNGALVVNHSTISGNTAGNGSNAQMGHPGGDGGAIYLSGGSVTIANSTISGNVAGNGGGAVGVTGIAGGPGGDGAGVAVVAGTLSVSGSTITGNTAGNGGAGGINGDPGAGGGAGGVFFSGSSATITNSTLTANTAGTGGFGSFSGGAGGGGGGILSIAGNVVIANSTIGSNGAGTGGGGAEFGGPGGNGGGIALSGGGTLTLTNATVASNAAGGGGVPGAGGGIYAGIGATSKNTLLVNNSPGGDCAGVGFAGGTINNIASDASCSGFTQQTPVQINLGALANNGGSTQTMALISPSTAIDAGDNASCATTPVNSQDQRGAYRPLDADGGGAVCDIGAFEACAADCDGDGYSDTVEAGAPLCSGTVNNDSFEDAIVNDGCPAVGPAEVTCAGPVDDDGDTFMNDGCPTSIAYSEAQFKVGTGSLDSCGNNGWPSNTWDTFPSNNQLDIQDILSFVAPIRRLDRSPPHADFNSRWDLVPGANAPFTQFINIVDLTTTLQGPLGSPAFPPMFSPLRAFGKDCPFAP